MDKTIISGILLIITWFLWPLSGVGLEQLFGIMGAIPFVLIGLIIGIETVIISKQLIRK